MRVESQPGRLLVQVPAGHLADLRAMTNVGIFIGALLGGLALWVDQSWAYLAVFALDAITCGATASWLRRCGSRKYTSALRSRVAGTLLINAICVAVQQVRLTRNIDLVGPSSRAMARSGFWIAGGFALIAFASAPQTRSSRGWLVLGGVIALASVLMVPASDWALRSREREGVLTHSG